MYYIKRPPDMFGTSKKDLFNVGSAGSLAILALDPALGVVRSSLPCHST